jgi:hypothetical protein
MNPAQQQVIQRIAALPPAVAPLRATAERYAGFCSLLDPDGVGLIGHMPWTFPFAFAVTLFPPAKKAWISRFRERAGIAVPAPYRDFLLLVNGCDALGLSLYGLPPSLQEDPPRLDRGRLQPLDLGAANARWARSFDADPGLFHFGTRNTSSTGQVGYFWGRDGLRALERDTGALAGEWPDLGALLRDELQAAERHSAEVTPAEWWH